LGKAFDNGKPNSVHSSWSKSASLIFTDVACDIKTTLPENIRLSILLFFDMSRTGCLI
jgi:hypothetical protein